MPYLTIQEATRLTGVSFTSIRRLAKRADGYQKRYEKGKLQILDSYLFDHYPRLAVNQTDNQANQLVNQINQAEVMPGIVNNQATQMGNQVNQDEEKPKFNEQYYQNLINAKEETIRVLSEQITNKDNQITTKDQQLNQLIERTREQNIIIQSLQEKVSLQLKPAEAPQSKQYTKQVNTPFVDKVLVGIAGIISIALLLFFALMLLAYLNR